MSEYIVRETDCGLATKQEIVGKLVRCKDCKHSRTDDVFGGRWCQLPGSIKVVREEFFCADGERRRR